MPYLSFYAMIFRSSPSPFLVGCPTTQPLVPSLTTRLALSIREDLTADPGHAGNGVGNNWSCSEGAQDLRLSPEGGCTDLWVEEKPCSEAKRQERAERGKRAEDMGQ